MRQSVRLRTTPTPRHPPYGLFPDPHRNSHSWWAIDSRTLIGLASVLASIGTLLSISAR